MLCACRRTPIAKEGIRSMSDTEPGASQEASHSPAIPRDNEERDADDLSPSVRRLVRQFNLDVTKLRGSGPDGRLRPSDIMAAVGGRSEEIADTELGAELDADAADKTEADAREAADIAIRFDNATPANGHGQAGSTGIIGAEIVRRDGQDSLHASERGQGIASMSCVFECDMSKVLAHRKAIEARAGRSPSITSYCVSAAGRALYRLAGKIEADREPAAISVVIYADGDIAKRTLADPATLSLDAIDAALERAPEPATTASRLLTLHHHGLAGSIVALPTPLAAGETASLGVGRVRRIVGIKSVNGEDTPRIVAQCLLSLSFDADRVALARANRFMAECVRILEGWPPPPAATPAN